MSTKLYMVIKGIVDKNGEEVLHDPRRMKSFLADLAKDEPKPIKNSFLKCLENGYVNILKNADETEIVQLEQRLVKKLNNDEGFDISLCEETVKLLINVLNIRQPTVKIKNIETYKNNEVYKKHTKDQLFMNEKTFDIYDICIGCWVCRKCRVRNDKTKENCIYCGNKSNKIYGMLNAMYLNM